MDAENVMKRLSCIVSLDGRRGFVPPVADFDNKIGNHVNLKPDYFKGQSEHLANSRVDKQFGYVGLVRSAIHEVDINFIHAGQRFQFDQRPFQWYLRQYGAAEHPRTNENYVQHKNKCCSLSSDWNDEYSSKAEEFMNIKWIFEEERIGSTRHKERIREHNLISNDALIPVTLTSESSLKKQKYDNSTDYYCSWSSSLKKISKALKDFDSSSLVSKSEVHSREEGLFPRQTSGGKYLIRFRDDGCLRWLEEHVQDVIRKID